MISKPTYFGWNPPFIGGPQNILSRQEDVRLIKNDILQLLLTVPGERVMRPTFGVPLRNFVFEQLDETSLIDLENSIRQAIAEFEQRVTIDAVELVRDDARNGLNIKILVRLVKDLKQVLTIEHFLAGGS